MPTSQTSTEKPAPQVADVKAHARQQGVDLRAIELDVGSQPSVDSAIASLIAERGRIDVVVHSAGGTPPYLSPYFAAKAGMDALAVQYARELTRWGIETSFVVPGAFTSGTNHFAHAGSPADAGRLAEYAAGPTAGLDEQIRTAFGRIAPPDADPATVADAIADLIDLPFGKRPFRIHIDPTRDGAAVTFAVMDRVRDQMLNRVGLSDLLRPVRKAAS